MKLAGRRKLSIAITFAFVAACLPAASLVYGEAGINAGEYIDRMARGEMPGWRPPSIEELTHGKVKIGDTITKDNVSVVREYLGQTVYECVNQGMVLRMAENVPPERIATPYFLAATVRNKGLAVMDENGTVTQKGGSTWQGGLPFIEPKTPLEAMANTKFGFLSDDGQMPHSIMFYVNKKGEIEKEAKMKIWQVKAFGRLKCPPLGTLPKHDGFQWRNIAVFTEPLELKGLGQLTIRHYDEYKDPDEGFLYLPSFKRVIRISATTYQDNVGGTDFTWGDPSGLREPYAFWNFQVMHHKLILMPEPDSAFPFVTDEGKIHKDLILDHGYSFPRLGWAVTPTTVIEATPKEKHIYGRKILYIVEPPYWAAMNPIVAVDIYDQQGKMWKAYFTLRDTLSFNGITYGMVDSGLVMHDLQTGHTTVNPWNNRLDTGHDIEDLSLTTLLRIGR